MPKQMKEIPYIETGTVDWGVIKKNFQDLFDAVNANIESQPPVGNYKIANIYVNATTGKLVVEYEVP